MWNRKETQSRLILDQRDGASASIRSSRIEDVGIAEGLFGIEFDIRSHDEVVRNLEVHFKADRKSSAARFEAQKRSGRAQKRLQILLQKQLSLCKSASTEALIRSFKSFAIRNGLGPLEFKKSLGVVARFTSAGWILKKRLP